MRHTLLRLSILACAAAASIPLQAQTPARVMGAPYHDASRAFIDLMIPHHDMAMMMSEHALTSARSDAVKEIARKMAESQKKEIAELKAARKALFGSDSSRSSMMRAMMEMMGMQHMRDSGAMPAMVDSTPMQPGRTPRPMVDSMRMRDSAARPVRDSTRMVADSMPTRHDHPPGGMQPGAMASHDFDHMFLEHMISHHRDGIDMALIAEHSAAAARVKTLAKKTREGQEREIAEMRRILASLPSAPTPVRKP